MNKINHRKLLKRGFVRNSLIGVVAIMILCAVGCQKGEQNEADTEDTRVVATQNASLVVDSEQALLTALTNAKTLARTTQDVASQNNNLAAIDVYYAPKACPSGFELFAAEVNSYRIFYYYMPTDLEEKPDYFDNSCGIIITVARVDAVNSEDPLAALEQQQNLTRDENGVLYDAAKKKLITQVENTWVSVVVPTESLNDYNAMRSMCEMERIVIE